MKFRGLVLSPFLPPKSQATRGHLPLTHILKTKSLSPRTVLTAFSSKAVLLGAGEWGCEGGTKRPPRLASAPI